MSCRFLGFLEGFLCHFWPFNFNFDVFGFRNCDSLVIGGEFSLGFAQIYLALLVWCGGEFASLDFYARAHFTLWVVRACMNTVW